MKHTLKQSILTAFLWLPWFPSTVWGASHIIDGSSKRPSLSEPVTANDFTDLISSLKGVGTFICGICTITALLFFIISIMKLSTSAGNEFERRRALMGILVSGVSLALFGGATVIIGVFWNLL